MTSAQTDRVLRTALFVDFDNVFSGLERLDKKAAEAFGKDPGRWRRWLEDGFGLQGVTRRLLVRNCYLNPATFSMYRSFFASAGFRVVDCPSLTQAGKSAADIHLVLDVADALVHSTRFDEILICSADADFAPVLTRVRAHDRTATIIVAGSASAAYKSVADYVIETDDFVNHLLGARNEEAVVDPDDEEIQDQSETGTAVSPMTGTGGEGDAVGLDAPVAAAVASIRGSVASVDAPIRSATVGDRALAAAPELRGTNWARTGSFAEFMRRHVSDLEFKNDRSGGYVYDPERHEAPATDVGQDSSIRGQVIRVTNIPRITTEQYAVLFDELASELVEGVYHFVETSKRVRDRASEDGLPVPRSAVSPVVQGILNSGLVMGSEPHTPTELAHAWREQVRQRCQTARMELTAEDEDELDRWILGESLGSDS